MKRLSVYVGLLLLTLIAAGCSGLAGEPQIVSTLPPVTPTSAAQTVSLPDTAPDLELGASVYAANCVRCHGETGKGDGQFVASGQIIGVPDFTDPQTAQGATPADWYEIITNGRMDKMMPPWVDALSDQERWSVANYVYSLGGNPVPAATTQNAVAQVPTTVGASDATPDATQEPAAAAISTPAATPILTEIGVVNGTVTNQTADASVPADLQVTLHVIDNDPQATQAAQTFNTTVNPDGSFQFEDVPMLPNGQYIAMTTYQHVVFNDQTTLDSADSRQIDIPLNIYEVTDDPSVIQVDGVLSMLQTQTGSLEVVQIVSFDNTSDHAFLQQNGGSAASVGVNIPAGAVYEDFSGGSYLLSDDGSQVFDTQPVLPGTSHVMHVGFTLPNGDRVNVAQPFDYALNAQVEVLADDSSTSISGDGVTRLGTRQLGDRSFVSYGGEFSLAAGDALDFTISGANAVAESAASATSGSTSGVSVIAYVLIGAGLLAIGAAFGFFMRERTSPQVTLNPNTLMKQIADLDLRFKDGRIAEMSYKKQRGALKAQLVELMKDKAENQAQSGAD